MGSGKVLSAQTGVGLPVSECDSMNSHSSEPCFGIKPQRSLMGKKKKIGKHFRDACSFMWFLAT